MKGARSALLLSVCAAALAAAQTAASAPRTLPPGDEVMRRVNARTRGEDSRMRLEMTLHDARRGDFRKSISMQRKRFPAGYRTAYWITAPEHEMGIGLLVSEGAPRSAMWMYFPGSRQLVGVKSRGLSALASDFSCEDLLVEVPLADYDLRTLGRERLGEGFALKVEMTPRTERLRSELGFSKSVGWVREDLWVIVQADYHDEEGKVFKRFRAEEITKVEGIWTVRRFAMQNLRAQHGTEVRVADVDYSVGLADELFTPERLDRSGS